jgi:tetratricopeptide (TPR) repeat protein
MAQPERNNPKSAHAWSGGIVSALLAVGCCAISLAVYWPATGFEWIVFDDPVSVAGNHYLTHGISWAGIRWAFTTGLMANWHPLMWISCLVDHDLFGIDAGAFHRTNIILHGLAAATLHLALWRLTGAVWRSAFVACVFALHPLHVESVAWVSQRKDVLSGLFWMLSLLAYAEYARRPFHPLRYAAVCAAMALGLMAKTVLVTLPFVLLLLDFWPLRRLAARDGEGLLDFAALRACVLEKLPLFVLSLLSSIVTYIVQREWGAMAVLEEVPLAQRIQNALVSYWVYLERTFWPRDLAVLYPIREIPLQTTVLASVALLAITVLALRSLRSRPYLAVGWFWYLGTFVPMIGLVQVGMQALADRYSYLPQTGIALAVAWAACEALPRHRAHRTAQALLAACALTLLAALGAATSTQLRHWKDSDSLLRHTLAVTRENPYIERLLVLDLIRRKQFSEAEYRLAELRRTQPQSAWVWVTLGELENSRDDNRRAAGYFQKALELDPNDYEANRWLGLIELGRSEFEAACEHLGRAARAHYGFKMTEVRGVLVICLVELGRFGEALPHLEFASAYQAYPEILPPYLALARVARGRADLQSLTDVELPTAGSRHRYAELLLEAGRTQEAIAQLEKALILAARARLPEPTRRALRERLWEVRDAQRTSRP